MSYQRRRRAIPATIWRSRLKTDRRGNKQLAVVPEDKIPVRVWIMPQRSAKAEAPGQVQINVQRIGFMLPEEQMVDINLWSHIELMGESWDFATPVSYHHGQSRHTRHYTADLRKRP